MIRTPHNVTEYRRIASRRCFLCNIVGYGTMRKRHMLLYEDDYSIAMLNRYPSQLGQVLVFPKQHVRDLFMMSSHDYARLTELARRVGGAIRDVTDAERTYLASLGSNQLNDHVHLHLVPMPRGVPLDKQQLYAMDRTRTGVLCLTLEERLQLQEAIVRALSGLTYTVVGRKWREVEAERNRDAA